MPEVLQLPAHPARPPRTVSEGRRAISRDERGSDAVEPARRIGTREVGAGGAQPRYQRAMGDATTILVRDGCWRWLDGTGLERFELRRGDAVWLLQGAIVALAPGGPVEARYRVVCDPGWRARRAEVALRDRRGERRASLTAGDGRWAVDGREEPGLRGCVDVDLEWTPSTNTLPLRRLGLAPGSGGGPLETAWVRFPALTVERQSQEYTRLARDRVRFSSGGGGFTAELLVDEDDVVVEYPAGWRRVEEA